jgi:hypothetical protein
MRKDLLELMEESRKRNEEYYNKHVAKMKEQFPQVDMEKAHTIMNNFWEMKVIPHDNNKVEYQVDSGRSMVWEMKTQLGLAVDMYEEFGWNYKEIEVGRYTLIVRDGGWDKADVSWFHKDLGHKIKGKRHRMTVGETSKGRFITIEKQRIYI